MIWRGKLLLSFECNILQRAFERFLTTKVTLTCLASFVEISDRKTCDWERLFLKTWRKGFSIVMNKPQRKLSIMSNSSVEIEDDFVGQLSKMKTNNNVDNSDPRKHESVSLWKKSDNFPKYLIHNSLFLTTTMNLLCHSKTCLKMQRKYSMSWSTISTLKGTLCSIAMPNNPFIMQWESQSFCAFALLSLSKSNTSRMHGNLCVIH